MFSPPLPDEETETSPSLPPTESPLWMGVLTLFPEIFSPLFHTGVVGRSLREQRLIVVIESLRNHSLRKDQRVDDRPYGGGPGMVLQYLPLKSGKDQLVRQAPSPPKVIYLSPQGRRLSQALIHQTAKARQPLLFICGRYQGIDQRFIDQEVDEEWSVGDYVLSGGEIAAMLCIDGLSRALPGTLNNPESRDQESFSEGLLDHPHYTRPHSVADTIVPDVLLSGHHAAIERWRKKQRLGNTWLKRPDLLLHYPMTDEESCLLKEFQVEYQKYSSLF